MKVFIVIAAYNEQKKIGSVIRQLKGYDVVVVDDGSKDQTYSIAKKANVHVLRHVINRGQGAALKTGIDYALSNGADMIVTFDADGQFLASEIPKVLQPIKDRKADITIGSRFLGRTVNMPLFKRLVLKLGVVVVYLLYGIKVTDSQCGFRAFTKEAASKISLKSDGMEHAGEFMWEIMRNSLRYKEVPITVIYDEYSLGKGQSWTNSLRLGLKMLFRRFMS
jgi:glycosyltransferase involved in cell wall biosynthesis